VQSKAIDTKLIIKVIRKYMIYFAFLGVTVFFSIVLRGKGFFTLSNALNIIRQTAPLTILGVGLTFVIATGGIDLSFGSIVGLSSLVAALVLSKGANLWIAFLATLLVGTIVGFCNGFLYAKVKIPSFISTLAMQGIVYGIALLPTDSAPVPIADETFNAVFGSFDVGVIPVLAFWSIITVILGHIMLRHLKYGRIVLAVGGNELSAKYSGINVAKVKFSVMTFCGFTAGLAGCLYAGRMHTGRCTFGQNSVNPVITAVVLGGTIMSGGKASVIGTLVGSILIGMISNGLVIMGLNVAQQDIVQGLILLLAIAFGENHSREA